MADNIFGNADEVSLSLFRDTSPNAYTSQLHQHNNNSISPSRQSNDGFQSSVSYERIELSVPRDRKPTNDDDEWLPNDNESQISIEENELARDTVSTDPTNETHLENALNHQRSQESRAQANVNRLFDSMHSPQTSVSERKGNAHDSLATQSAISNFAGSHVSESIKVILPSHHIESL